jgi:hypothetical protein
MRAELDTDLVHRLRLGSPAPALLPPLRRPPPAPRRRTIPSWAYGVLASILGLLALARILTPATIR